MSKILLIYPKPKENKNPRFGVSLNLLYLSSILKTLGHEIIDYLDFSLSNYSQKEIEDKIKLTDFTIIEIDSFSLKRSENVSHAEDLIKTIKLSFPEKKIIVFGYDLILLPRKIPFSDYIITTDNYLTKIAQIINGNDLEIPDYMQNFDQLPFPDRSILSTSIEHGGSLNHKPNLMKSTLIQTSKGCLNTCRFCQRKGWQKRYVAHTVDYVISEFKYLRDNNYVNIWISDDNFTHNLKRAKKILEELINKNISKNMKISCSSWTRIDKEFLDLAKKANIKIISFGIESAEEEILRFYNKSIDLKFVVDIIKYADSIGLYTVGNFIIGAPMETEKTISKTFQFAIETPFDQVNVKTLDYMIGSELFDSLPKNIKGNNRHIFASKEIGLNDFSIFELIEKINKFKMKFNQIRESVLKEKILKYGSPYEMSNKIT